MSTPQSRIYICNGVPLNNRYEHTIYFSSVAAQKTYFAGKVVTSFSAYTFLRRTWSIKVQTPISTARGCSYLYFQNPEDGNKTYYYFITSVEYINESTVELFLELDVMQTYHFDYSMFSCFVEREHVSDDSIGSHTVEENVETGDYKIIDSMNVNLGNLCCLVMATFNPVNTTEENTDTVLAANYNGVFSGLGVYAVAPADFNAWGLKLKQLDEWGKSDGIIAMWMYPIELVKLAGDYTWTDGNVTKEVQQVNTMYQDIARNTKLSGSYVPRNNKLYTYPYNFLYATNNNGGSAVYHYERFGVPAECNFRVCGSISPDGACHVYPLNYNGHQHNYESGLSLGGYPTCAWNQDVYKLWLAQNQNQNKLAVASGVLSIGAGVVGALTTGGLGAMVGGGAVVSGVSQIAGLVAQKKDRAIQPPQAKGGASCSVTVANAFQQIELQRKSVSSEYAKIIDDYFDMYGYQVNRVKVPNRNVRENWTFCKTVDCHIRANFCIEDQTKIESIYNKGITFWVNGNSIGDYSLSNKTV